MAKGFIIENNELMKEWDWEKNDALGFYPDKIRLGSSNKIWWRCKECNFEWAATPGHRSARTRATGCPKCSAYLRSRLRVLNLQKEHNISLDFPKLLEEWDWENNENILHIKPNQITKGSHDKIFWKCKKCGRSWQTIVNNRIKGHGCPYCSGRLAIKGVNDLLTIDSKLAEEWNFEKNGELTPDNVTAMSQKLVYWKCKTCGHEWKSSVSNRRTRGCPHCSEYRRTSMPEKTIIYYLSKYFLDIKENAHFSWLKNMELDIYIPQLKLGIEYDGEVWHKNDKRDIEKDNLCDLNGVRLIRIREPKLIDYNSTAHFIYAKNVNSNLQHMQNVMENVLQYIKDVFNVETGIEINIKNDYYDIVAKMKDCGVKNSLGSKFPELLDEWDYEKNDINPFFIAAGSSLSVWWKCKNGHNWKATIANRTNISNRNKCPYCQRKIPIKGENDLISINAPCLVDWNYSKNVIKPEDCMLHSGKVVWWKCHICGYEWESSVDSRSNSKAGCKACSMKKAWEHRTKMVLNVDTGIEYASVNEASEILNISPIAIRKACCGYRKTGAGYHWKYLE